MGQWISEEVKKEMQYLLYIPKCYPWAIYAMAFRPQISLEVTISHWRSKFWKYTQGLHFRNAYYYDIPDQYKLWHFDLKNHLRSPKVTQLDRYNFQSQWDRYLKVLGCLPSKARLCLPSEARLCLPSEVMLFKPSAGTSRKAGRRPVCW